MERNVARLFRDHVSLFGEVQFSQSSILAGKAEQCRLLPLPWDNNAPEQQTNCVCQGQAVMTKLCISLSETEQPFALPARMACMAAECCCLAGHNHMCMQQMHSVTCTLSLSAVF